MRYNFSISHVPGKQLLIADALSRSPSQNPTETDESLHQEGNAFIDAVMQGLPATEKRIEQIKQLQQEDQACQLVTKYIYSSWPDKKSAPTVVRPFLSLAAEFSVENGLLMRGCRIVIPSSLQQELLSKLHTGHQGITRTRDRARQSVWWPSLSAQLETLVKNCETCCKNQRQRAQPLISSQLPELPWQKVGTDLFEWRNKNFLLIVDYYSRYIEIAKLSKTTAEEVILHTKSIFARHGISEIVFSDNGPQYTANAYEKFASDYQFEHKTSSPYFPQSNGEAERAVQTVKEMLKRSDDPYLSLLNYRSTPIQGGIYSPAELLMSRTLRTTLPTTRKQRTPKVPDAEEVRARDKQAKDRQKKNFDQYHGVRVLPDLKTGSKVWIPAKETEATVQSQVAPRSLQLSTDQGSEIRRNRRDIIALPETNSPQPDTDSPQPETQEDTNLIQEPEPEPDKSQAQAPRRSQRHSAPPDRYGTYVTH